MTQHPGSRRLAAIGFLLMALCILLGAIGSHAIDGNGRPEDAARWAVAVRYHAWSALGLLAVAWCLRAHPASRLLPVAAGLMLAGMLLFCGSLYVACLTGWSGLIVATPVGGLLQIVAWLAAGVAMLRPPPSEQG